MKQLRYLVLLLLITPGVIYASALHDYVAKPDANYAWRIVAQEPFSQGTRFVLHMVSQAWLTDRDVGRTIWRHWLVLNVPNRLDRDTALLYIGGSDNSRDPPQKQEMFIDMAVLTHSITAELYNVPNQPLTFLSDPNLRQRTEDDILAFGWAEFYRLRDPEWLALLPMTKSAVRAMDTIHAFSNDPDDERKAVNRFVVSGASKRGWTTWLCAAVDKRVIAIAPVVIDALNMEESIRHHYRAYGFYSEALTPYVENGITESLFTPRSQAARAIIDPYTYHRDILIPKCIINSTGDQYFLPDSAQFYYRDLQGPKYLRYIPNTDHGLDETAGATLRTFYRAVLRQRTLPTFTWTKPTPGSLVVHTQIKPRHVRLWQADNPSARDFRLETIGPAWTSREVAARQTSPPGLEYAVTVSPPQRGWTAFMMELIFDDPVQPKGTVTLTTDVTVIPETLPFQEESKAPPRDKR